MTGSRETLCLDCRVDVNEIDEWYMVHDEVWRSAGLDPSIDVVGEFLCISCLETRLGRELTTLDFTDAPVNKPWPYHSERLLKRLTST